MAFFAREFIAVPDERKGQIVFKWPDQQIRRFTKAIVAPDEVAVFMYQGRVLGSLPPGRHAVDASEIPFLGTFADMISGNNMYRAELYFVSTHEFTEQRFGGRVDDVQDPVTGLVVGLRVFGEYSLRVNDPAALLLTLTGTVDTTDNTAITGWVAEQLLKVLRADVTAHIVSKGWPILGLAAYVPEIEASIVGLAGAQLVSYGLAVPRMGNVTITLSDEDAATLKSLAKDTAYSRLAGSYQQYAAGALQIGAGQGMAKGGSGTGGAFVAAGLGLGGQAMQMPPPGPPPPPAPGFSGGGAGYAPSAGAVPGPAGVTCPRCRADNGPGSKFCAACGAGLVTTHVCPGCDAHVDPDARFCPACGRALTDPPPGQSPPSA